MMRVNALFKFIQERHRIYERRAQGVPKPWTRDPILRQYRFTNVYRELDTVTIWIRENWRSPHCDDPNLWFALAVARYINWPETLAAIGYPVPFKAEKVCRIMRERQASKQQVFTGAYFINSIGPKIESVVFDRLNRMWENRKEVCARLDRVTYLAEMYEVLHEQFGFGSFMAGQVVADLKYVRPWTQAPDWHTWAVSGPGSKRGMYRLLGLPLQTAKRTFGFKRPNGTLKDCMMLTAPWKEREWFAKLHELQAKLDPLLEQVKMPPMHAQDVQGCLCEFDKYERVRLDEGQPRAKYPGEKE